MVSKPVHAATTYREDNSAEVAKLPTMFNWEGQLVAHICEYTQRRIQAIHILKAFLQIMNIQQKLEWHVVLLSNCSR